MSSFHIRSLQSYSTFDGLRPNEVASSRQLNADPLQPTTSNPRYSVIEGKNGVVRFTCLRFDDNPVSATSRRTRVGAPERVRKRKTSLLLSLRTSLDSRIQWHVLPGQSETNRIVLQPCEKD